MIAPELETPVPSDLLGQVINERYRVEALLGAGAMGVVYRATQTALGKHVALKVLHIADHFGSAVERFIQEARVAANLRHDGIAEVYDFGVTAQGLPYYAMELLEGSDLAHRIAACSPLSPPEAVRIARAVASAMAAAHAAGIIHRDLKPANIFLVRSSTGCEQIKVVDFGISKVLQTPAHDGQESPDPTKLTLPGTVFGTPCYLSPEQAAGRAVDARSDIYCLGAVLYEMLSGFPPFQAPVQVQVLTMHLTEPVPPLAEKCPGLQVPAALEAAVRRALSKEPADRFASMSDFSTALAAAVRKPGGAAASSAATSSAATSSAAATTAARSRAAAGPARPVATPDRAGAAEDATLVLTDVPFRGPRRRLLIATLALVCLLASGAWWLLRSPRRPIAGTAARAAQTAPAAQRSQASSLPTDGRPKVTIRAPQVTVVPVARDARVAPPRQLASLRPPSRPHRRPVRRTRRPDAGVRRPAPPPRATPRPAAGTQPAYRLDDLKPYGAKR